MMISPETYYEEYLQGKSQSSYPTTDQLTGRGKSID